MVVLFYILILQDTNFFLKWSADSLPYITVCISLSWAPLTSFPRAIEYPVFCMLTAPLASANHISYHKLAAPKLQQLLCISHIPHAGHSWKPNQHASGTTEPWKRSHSCGIHTLPTLLSQRFIYLWVSRRRVLCPFFIQCTDLFSWVK